MKLPSISSSENKADQKTEIPHRKIELLFQPKAFTVFLLLVLFLAYPDVLLATSSFFNRDFGLFTYPVASLHKASFWAGEMPLWNPLNHCGIPFLAQWNTGVLYPGSLLYVLLPLPWSLNLFCLLHLIVAGLGMYLLAFRWTENRVAACIAGTAFAWNGLIINCLMWTSNLAALALMPWLVLYAEKAWKRDYGCLIKAVLIGGAQMLTGAPEIILLTWMIIGLLGASEAFAKNVQWTALISRAVLLVVLVAGLSAAQILPFLDLLSHSEREPSLSSADWSMSSWGWVNFLLPMFRCTPSVLGVFSQNDQHWTSSYYVGIGTILFALLAVFRMREPRVLLLGGLSIVGFCMSMGDATPLYALGQKVVPGLSVMRYPVKFVVAPVFILPLLAAVGFSSLRKSSLRQSFSRLTIVGLGLLLGMVGILFYASRDPHTGPAWSIFLTNAAIRMVFLLLTVCAAALSKTRWTSHLGIVLILLMVLDVLSHMPKQNPTVATRAYQLKGMNEIVSARVGKSRVILHPFNQAQLFRAAIPDPFLYTTGCRGALFLDTNIPEEIPSVSGFFSLHLKREVDVHARLFDHKKSIPEPLLDFLGVSHISVKTNMFEWEQRPNFMPLVSAGQRPEFTSEKDTLAAITSPEFDPRLRAYLPLESRSLVQVTNSSVVALTNLQVSAHKIKVDVDAGQPALVVISQSYYHRWQAYVDGKKVPLLLANYAYQAVEVPPGEHTLELAYEDWPFRIGVLISCASLAACLVIWWMARRRSISGQALAG